MELNTLKDLYLEELKDLYSAELQILKALPRTLDEEEATDKLLTQIAESSINIDADGGQEEEAA